MTKDEYKERLKKSGVKGLKEFGYPTVSVDNICTDQIYSSFFLRQLEDALDERGIGRELKAAIEELIAECKKAAVAQ